MASRKYYIFDAIVQEKKRKNNYKNFHFDKK